MSSEDHLLLFFIFNKFFTRYLISKHMLPQSRFAKYICDDKYRCTSANIILCQVFVYDLRYALLRMYFVEGNSNIYLKVGYIHMEIYMNHVELAYTYPRTQFPLPRIHTKHYLCIHAHPPPPPSPTYTRPHIHTHDMYT